jgi:hypothetical protein
MQAAGVGSLTGNAQATTTMMAHAINSFLFQLFLMPLYASIIIQKTLICSGNSIMAVGNPIGFSITLGRSDLQNASGAAAGVCVQVSFFIISFFVLF